MPTMVNHSAEITVSKKTGTLVTLLTDDKYCDSNQQITINVQEGTGAANTASADVNVSSTQGSAGGTNISSIVGNKSGTEPSSGYYIRMDASGSGSSKVTNAGWFDAGNLDAASAQATKYFPITEGSVTQNAPTINTSTGVVTATASTSEGYVPADASADSNTLQLQTQEAATITPTRQTQTAVAAGKYTIGNVIVGPIPNNYRTLQEVYPVGCLYCNDTGDNPNTELGFGTWKLIMVGNNQYMWSDVVENTWQEINDDNDDWSFSNKIVDTIYVYRRTA